MPYTVWGTTAGEFCMWESYWKTPTPTKYDEDGGFVERGKECVWGRTGGEAAADYSSSPVGTQMQHQCNTSTMQHSTTPTQYSAIAHTMQTIATPMQHQCNSIPHQ